MEATNFYNMKKLLILAVAFTLSLGVFAQDKTDKKMDQKMGMKKDCVMMEDGKMMVMKGDNSVAMDKDMKMSNGTIVMTDGTVKIKDGKTMMMKDGDCVYMNGKMGKMKMDKMKNK
jgi:hypothetical protein